MGRFKKGIAFCLLAAVVATTAPISADACNKTSGCYATGETSTCGAVQGAPSGSHKITEPNGYVATCYKNVVFGPHTIRCAGCNAYLRSEVRTCSETHSDPHCYNRYNLCK